MLRISRTMQGLVAAGATVAVLSGCSTGSTAAVAKASTPTSSTSTTAGSPITSAPASPAPAVSATRTARPGDSGPLNFASITPAKFAGTPAASQFGADAVVDAAEQVLTFNATTSLDPVWINTAAFAPARAVALLKPYMTATGLGYVRQFSDTVAPYVTALNKSDQAKATTAQNSAGDALGALTAFAVYGPHFTPFQYPLGQPVLANFTWGNIDVRAMTAEGQPALYLAVQTTATLRGRDAQNKPVTRKYVRNTAYLLLKKPGTKSPTVWLISGWNGTYQQDPNNTPA